MIPRDDLLQHPVICFTFAQIILYSEDRFAPATAIKIEPYLAAAESHWHVADLTSVRLRVKDIGGYWEARIGDGEKALYLKSGGDITFVTDQKVEALPPNFILGTIERPALEYQPLL